MASKAKVHQAEWRLLVATYGSNCLCCGRPKQRLTKDHVHPVCQGGDGRAGNIQPLCGPCNSKKGATVADYRPDKGKAASLIEALELTEAPTDAYLRSYVEWLSAKLREAPSLAARTRLLRAELEK